MVWARGMMCCNRLLVAVWGDKSCRQTLRLKEWVEWENSYIFGCVFCKQPAFFTQPKTHLEKAMAPHSSTLAWKIPWMEEPGRLQSMGLPRVGYGWVTSLSLFTFMHWRRKRQPTLVFLPGESQGWGSLVGCCLWGHTESDTTEVT